MLDVLVHWYLLKINQYNWFVIIDVCAWCWNTSKEEPTFVLLPSHWNESTREGHVCVRNSLGYEDFHLMWLFGLGKIMQWPVRKLLFILIRQLASLCNGTMCRYILPAVISVVCWAVVPSMRAYVSRANAWEFHPRLFDGGKKKVNIWNICTKRLMPVFTFAFPIQQKIHVIVKQYFDSTCETCYYHG